MPIRRAVLPVLLSLAVLVSGGCASLQGRAPVEVMVAGVEPLQGEGLELRMLVKLRIQNPNDQPLEFNGVSLQMDVQGRRFATGVSGASGSVPRFGEALVEVPVSVPVLRIAQQAIGVLADERRGRLAYEMSGRLAGPAFRSLRFRSSGELALPAELFPAE
jgi:LEA14-like dessication related protein